MCAFDNAALLWDQMRHASLREMKQRLILFFVTAPFWIWGIFSFLYGSLDRTSSLTLAAIYGLWHVSCFFRKKFLSAALGIAIAGLLPLFGFFFLMQPSQFRDWQADVSELPHAVFSNNSVTVYNVRNCAYTSPSNYTPRFETRTYDLNALRTLDVFSVDWGLHAIAHTLVSFGFSDGQYLCFSAEARKKKGDTYSAIRGFFRQYELIYVAGDERDLIRLRTNFRSNEVTRLYPITKAKPELIKAMFTGYIERINALHARPEWYNAFSQNCMAGFVDLLKQEAVPGYTQWHWSSLLTGYAAHHAYTIGALDQTQPFDVIQKQAIINDKARKAHDAVDFSQRIRASD